MDFIVSNPLLFIFFRDPLLLGTVRVFVPHSQREALLGVFR